MKLSYWSEFSKKLEVRIDRLSAVGYFTAREAEEKEMRLVTGREGSLCLYWLVDLSDGVIADAKFQAIGPIGLIAAAEIASELVLRKNYDQASRLSAELIDRHVRDRKDSPAFPKECFPFLNQVLMAIDKAVHQCIDIPYAASYEETPIEGIDLEGGGIPGWESFPPERKRQIIEEVVEKEIRPYIELDAGGIKILEIQENDVVKILYEGSCTSCHSSTGSTLAAIRQILRARIHPGMDVAVEI